MFFVEALQKYFNDRAARKQLEREIEAAAQKALGMMAPNARDGSLRDALAAKDWNSRQAQNFVSAAIETDDPETFGIVLDVIAKNDPNYMLVSDYNDGDDCYDFHVETPLLQSAIKSGKGNIAVILAENPKTDVLALGFTDKTCWDEDDAKPVRKYHKNALEIVRETTLDKAHSIVANRFAEEKMEEGERLKEGKRQEAVRLYKESQIYAPSSP